MFPFVYTLGFEFPWHPLKFSTLKLKSTQLREFEATLSNSPKDPIALEGAAVTLAELGEYTRAASLLENLTKEKPNDPDVLRLLGEVKYKLKDYDGSANAYESSAKAVRFLVATREDLTKENSNAKADRSTEDSEIQKLDPIQVDLLLGKAYSDWGHISDAVSVYDRIISSHPEDFRGYLAKGIILKENGNNGDAERMFIQVSKDYRHGSSRRRMPRYLWIAIPEDEAPLSIAASVCLRKDNGMALSLTITYLRRSMFHTCAVLTMKFQMKVLQETINNIRKNSINDKVESGFLLLSLEV
ncbi:hypothetical protein F8388_005940 [Cannabis sativa]|uniref:Uncharacterized protein n=1 Tax=Cannabis sativa TaxID=3483 RepID=A0A7J6E1J8_CANSA|nr:hypothetical protein F8388_005940 [Cannabis sativa]